MKKIGITGAFGFIASHTIEVAHQRGLEVVGLVRHINFLPTKKPDYYPDYIYVGDIRDKEVVEKFVTQTDGVINLAGILGTQETVKNPYPAVEVNITGALNVYEACKIWDIPLIQISVGNYWMNNPYSITKHTAERLALMYAQIHKLKVNVVRGLNVFGERQKDFPVRKMMASFMRRAVLNQPIQIYGDGNQLMDFVYVKDIANIMLDILLNPKKILTTKYKPASLFGNVYEVGTGKSYRVRQLAEMVIEAVGSKSKIEYLPMRPGEPPFSIVVAENPVVYPYTDIKVAIKKTAEWYKKNI